tara:strand:- start:18952 stop:19917 length:966 start_codon:yes stop_codon:yes gene_type:complete
MPDKTRLKDIISNEKILTIFINEDDSYFEKNILNTLKQILGDSIYSTNVIVRDLSEKNNIVSILDEMNTFPFGKEKRYFIIKNIDKLKKDEFIFFNEYNLKPNPKAKVFYFSSKSNIKIKTDKEIKFKNTRDSIDKLIRSKFSEININLKDEIFKELSSKISDNRLVADKEIDNILKIYESSNDINLVEKYISNSKREFFNDTFSLDFDINNKNRKKLLVNFEKTEFKENIFMEIGRITWKYKLYLKIKILLKKGYSDEKILKISKISKYQYKYVKQESQNLSLQDILKTLSLLVDSDKKLKSTDIPHEIISFNLLKNLTK